MDKYFLNQHMCYRYSDTYYCHYIWYYILRYTCVLQIKERRRKERKLARVLAVVYLFQGALPVWPQPCIIHWCFKHSSLLCTSYLMPVSIDRTSKVSLKAALIRWCIAAIKQGRPELRAILLILSAAAFLFYFGFTPREIHAYQCVYFAVSFISRTSNV